MAEPDEQTVPMDYGPYLATSVCRRDHIGATTRPAPSFTKYVPPANNRAAQPFDPMPDTIAQKGIVIHVGGGGAGAKGGATVCFDTDVMSMASGWTGAFLDLTETMLTNHKGSNYVGIGGAEQFRCDSLGWGAGPTGDDFTDPRPAPNGPVPAERAHYRGLYLHGSQVVLSYTVADAGVLEVPGFQERQGVGAYTRTIRIEASAKPLTMAVCEVKGATGDVANDTVATLISGDAVTKVVVVGAPKGAALRAADGAVRLALPPAAAPAVFEVVVWTGNKAAAGSFAEWVKGAPAPVDPKTLCAGGPPRWKTLETVGRLGEAGPKAKGAADPAYVADDLTLPDKNPWNSWLRLTGLDFFPDGRGVVCTLNGDVWIVSGIDDKLDHLTWTRFATGLYHPMGLKVVGDQVFVRGRDQLTRLHDLNGDGEADFYENFNNEGMAHPAYHGFVFDLQTDDQGNFYYARGGVGMRPELPGFGFLTKLSKDGTTVTNLSSGLRAPNGLGDGPNGWILVADNQGNWIPSSKIDMVDTARPGEFLGFLPNHHMANEPKDFTKPMVWIPHSVDPSSGGEAYVNTDKWGPYQGQWVHTSYGTACMMVLLPDISPSKGGDAPPLPKQAAVARFPLNFATGIMRPRFNPHDGQLYVCGVGGGWQTSGTRDGALYRVRYTGKPAVLPSAYHVVPGGIQLSFPVALDPKSAGDDQNWGAEQWNYVWSPKYGSPDMSVVSPGKAEHDQVEIKSVAVSPDGKTVTLNIADLRPVMQMLIQYNLKTAAGQEIQQDVYATINAIPNGKAGAAAAR